MAKSTAMLTDIGTVITNGPGATTLATVNAAAGPLMDYLGNCNLVKTKLQEAEVQLAAIKTDTDSTDSTNLTLINGLLAVINGTGSPSTAVLTDINSVISNGPNAATLAKAIIAAGPILDYPGMTHSVRRKVQEIMVLLGGYTNDPVGGIYSVTASGDTANKALLLTLVNVLV